MTHRAPATEYLAAHDYIAAIRRELSDKYLHPDVAKLRPDGAPKSWGHCYIATEALYYLYGRAHGYRPYCVRMDKLVHWFLKHDRLGVLDPTSDQFDWRTPIPYLSGLGKGFLPPSPCLRTRTLIQQVKATMASAQQSKGR